MAQDGAVSSVDEQKPFTIERHRLTSKGRATPNQVAQWRKMAQFHPLTSKNPLRSSARAIGRAKLCHHLTQWLCHKGWSAAVAYLLAKVLLILVTTLSH